MKTQKIKDIQRRHHNEWLLIGVDKVDESTGTPIAGHLLVHSKDRDEIYKKMMKYKTHTYVTCSEDKMKKGLAVAFNTTPFSLLCHYSRFSANTLNLSLSHTSC